jgi:hypothetical protein
MKFNCSKMASVAIVVSLLSAESAIAFPKFVPLQTRSDLRGTLKFYPDDGSHPFKCKVRIVLFTGKGNQGLKGKRPEVDKAAGVDCSPFFSFGSLPWTAVPGDDDVTAQLLRFAWNVEGSETCSQTQVFSVNKSGVWTATSGCVTGSLTSNPPITIKH